MTTFERKPPLTDLEMAQMGIVRGPGNNWAIFGPAPGGALRCPGCGGPLEDLRGTGMAGTTVCALFDERAICVNQPRESASSSERAPLEPTKEQHRALFDALKATGMPEWRIKSVDVLWPLIRDMVLEEAAKACEENVLRQAEDTSAGPEGLSGIANCIDAIRELKGTP